MSSILTRVVNWFKGSEPPTAPDDGVPHTTPTPPATSALYPEELAEPAPSHDAPPAPAPGDTPPE